MKDTTPELSIRQIAEALQQEREEIARQEQQQKDEAERLHNETTLGWLRDHHADLIAACKADGITLRATRNEPRRANEIVFEYEGKQHPMGIANDGSMRREKDGSYGPWSLIQLAETLYRELIVPGDEAREKRDHHRQGNYLGDVVRAFRDTPPNNYDNWMGTRAFVEKCTSDTDFKMLHAPNIDFKRVTPEMVDEVFSKVDEEYQ